ncbi:MAG TPA: MaoC family dehydratase [Mycobacteriales bacterium]|nr:dehydratase [Mycobacterium sp.]
MKSFPSVASLTGAVGTVLGPGPWLEIDQDRVDLFADATGDHQWIHVDPERAAGGPFGGTIAHGYLTLSMLPVLMKDLYAVDGVKLGINYGLNKVRFPAPVRVGSKVRLTAEIASVDEIPGGVQVVLRSTVEADGTDKPVCVAESVVRYLG